MLLVPFLTYLLGARQVAPDLAVKMAIATIDGHHRVHLCPACVPTTSVEPCVGTSSPSSLQALCWAVCGQPRCVCTAQGSFLAVFFGLFVSFSAADVSGQKPAPLARCLEPQANWALVASSVFCLGLVGAGGGFVSVPFMTWCNVPIHNAVATSAALGFPIALANVVGYVISGQSVTSLPAGSFGLRGLPALGVIATCSVLTALWEPRRRITFRSKSQTGVCQPALRLGRLHVLEGRLRVLMHHRPGELCLHWSAPAMRSNPGAAPGNWSTLNPLLHQLRVEQVHSKSSGVRPGAHKKPWNWSQPMCCSSSFWANVSTPRPPPSMRSACPC